MATRDATCICGICDLQHLSKPSAIWCLQCEDALCLDCDKHHSLSKGTRNHQTIPITDYQKLPPFIADIKQHCPDHNERYLLFCLTHDCPLCYKCITSHSECKDVKPIDDVVEHAKTSDLFNDLEKSLADLKANITKIKKNREDTMETITAQKTKSISDIEHFRQQINDHLDALVKKLTDELADTETKTNQQIQNLIKKLDDTHNDLSNYETMTENIKSYASDIQVFFGMREIESKVTEYDQFVQSIIHDSQIEEFIMTCVINSNLQKLITDIETFGSVQIDKNPSKLNIVTTKEKQAQNLVAVKQKSIDSISLELKQKIKVDANNICGCFVTSSKELIVTKHMMENGLLFVNRNQDRIISCKILDINIPAFDLTFLDDTTIAVTTGDYGKNGVQIIDLTSNRITNFINLPGRTYGIALMNQSIVCCVEGKGICLINSTNYSHSIIVQYDMASYCYVSAHGDKICFTDHSKHTISCCDLHGAAIWTFENWDVIQTPRGIKLDNDGNVYVACGKYSRLLVISPDGQKHKILLNESDGFNDPTALTFDNSCEQLYIASWRDHVNCYNIGIHK